MVGAVEVFTFIGQMEFFYEQARDALRSADLLRGDRAVQIRELGASPSCGGSRRHQRWSPGVLDYFFAMFCVGNFGAYLLFAWWHNSKKTAD
ncbi:protein NRT1/ PTR FAMILY 8.2-like [Aegilops tauschii subsp. strangulata]